MEEYNKIQEVKTEWNFFSIYTCSFSEWNRKEIDDVASQCLKKTRMMYNSWKIGEGVKEANMYSKIHWYKWEFIVWKYFESIWSKVVPSGHEWNVEMLENYDFIKEEAWEEKVYYDLKTAYTNSVKNKEDLFNTPVKMNWAFIVLRDKIEKAKRFCDLNWVKYKNYKFLYSYWDWKYGDDITLVFTDKLSLDSILKMIEKMNPLEISKKDITPKWKFAKNWEIKMYNNNVYNPNLQL